MVTRDKRRREYDRKMKRLERALFYKVRTLRNRMVQLAARKRNPVQRASEPWSESDCWPKRIHGLCALCKNPEGTERPCGNPCNIESYKFRRAARLQTCLFCARLPLKNSERCADHQAEPELRQCLDCKHWECAGCRGQHAWPWGWCDNYPCIGSDDACQGDEKGCRYE